MFYKKTSQIELSEQELKDAAAANKDKTPEELKQEKLEKKAAAMKQKATTERMEQLEYYRFPNIMGWYFDGTFTKDFTLHEEYAEYFNEIEEELDAQKDLIIEETFTERAFRYFWPPKFLCGGKYFRTRGIYLDFKEVKEDPPKTPPNINYEKNRGVIGVEMDKEQQKLAEEEETKSKQIVPTSGYGVVGWRNSRDHWYWNEIRREFKPKEQDGDYIWANDEKIWLESDPTFRTPYDWYFDESLGRFFIRDRTTPDQYEFDKEKNVYVKKDAKGPSDNGLRINDYYYDEHQRRWLPIRQAAGLPIVFYHAGMREVLKGDRGASGLTPDDFYYDGETGKMHEKTPGQFHEYFYDTRDKVWKQRGQPYGPGEANHYPMDYEFDYKLGTYFPKPSRECKHLEPNDFYFDNHEGKFFRMDGHERNKYIYDPEHHIFILKGSEGPALNALGVEDYFWNENERTWKLVVTVKDPATQLDYHDAGKRRVMRGDRGRSNKVPDDFYYDAVDGSFFRKDMKRLSIYWFDPEDMVWKKRGQPYGPGYFRLYPEHYYFDYDEGYYFPTTTAKQLLSKLRSGELKGVNDRTPYDFAFNDLDGYFQLRDKDMSRHSKYRKETGVYHIDLPYGIKEATHGKTPKDFFFDEFTATWLPIEHPKGVDAKYYRHGRRNNRQGPRGHSGKIPDDYYFDFATGTFELKAKEEDGEHYDYLPDMGVWKKIGAEETGGQGILKPKEYYFDKEEGKFILKSKLQYGEIYLNPFTNLWMQRWRCPADYYWEPRQNKYLRKPASKKEVVGTGIPGGPSGGRMSIAQMEASREAELEQNAKEKRDYDRPWLHNFLVQAADEIRFEQELLKAKTREAGEAKLLGIEKGPRKGPNKPLIPELANQPPPPPHKRESIHFVDEEDDEKGSKGSAPKPPHQHHHKKEETTEKTSDDKKVAKEKPDKTSDEKKKAKEKPSKQRLHDESDAKRDKKAKKVESRRMKEKEEERDPEYEGKRDKHMRDEQNHVESEGKRVKRLVEKTSSRLIKDDGHSSSKKEKSKKVKSNEDTRSTSDKKPKKTKSEKTMRSHERD